MRIHPTERPKKKFGGVTEPDLSHMGHVKKRVLRGQAFVLKDPRNMGRIGPVSPGDIS